MADTIKSGVEIHREFAGLVLQLDDVDQIYLMIDKSIADIRDAEKKFRRFSAGMDSDLDLEKLVQQISTTIVINDSGGGLQIIETKDIKGAMRGRLGAIDSVEITSSFTSNTTFFNHVNLKINLRLPRIIDFSSGVPAQDRTSALYIRGTDDNWVRGLEAKLEQIFESRRTMRQILFTKWFYWAVLSVVGFPIIISVMSFVNQWISVHLTTTSDAMRIPIFIYIYFVVLWIFRLVYNWLCRVFPSTEVKENMPNSISMQRKICYVVVVCVLLPLVLRLILD